MPLSEKLEFKGINYDSKSEEDESDYQPWKEKRI